MPQGAEAVHAANPKLLVILSGIDFDTNLSFLRDRSVNVSFTDKLVFELHWYSFSDGRDSWRKHNSNDFCVKIIEKVTHNGGFLLGRGFPLILSEFGTDQRGGDMSGNRYMNCLVAWAAENDLDWAVWALTGDYYLRTGKTDLDESYGLLQANWKTSETLLTCKNSPESNMPLKVRSVFFLLNHLKEKKTQTLRLVIDYISRTWIATQQEPSLPSINRTLRH